MSNSVDRILVARIEHVGDLDHLGIDVLCVRDLAVIQRQEHILADHLLDDVVRREAEIVRAVGRAQLDQHFLVAGHFDIVDLDAGFLFKQLDQLFVSFVAIG